MANHCPLKDLLEQALKDLVLCAPETYHRGKVMERHSYVLLSTVGNILLYRATLCAEAEKINAHETF